MKIRFPVLAAILSTLAATSLGACGSDSSSGSGMCGNGTVETGEDCDVSVPAAANCSTATMGVKTGGMLQCSAMTCKFDTSLCTGAGGGSGTGGGPGTGTGGGR